MERGKLKKKEPEKERTTRERAKEDKRRDSEKELKGKERGSDREEKPKRKDSRAEEKRKEREAEEKQKRREERGEEKKRELGTDKEEQHKRKREEEKRKEREAEELNRRKEDQEEEEEEEERETEEEEEEEEEKWKERETEKEEKQKRKEKRKERETEKEQQEEEKWKERETEKEEKQKRKEKRKERETEKEQERFSGREEFEIDHNILEKPLLEPPSKNKQILVLGLDGAGKTSVLHSLALNRVQHSRAPTQGFNAVCICTEDRQMEFLEIGGSEPFRPYWPMYIPQGLLLIFVVDSADHSRLPEAKKYLHQLIRTNPSLPLVVFANKQDLETAYHITDIHEALALSEVGNNRKMFLFGTQVTENGSEIPSTMQDAKGLIAQLAADIQ